MPILEEKQKFLNTTRVQFPAKLRLLYEFGIFALSVSQVGSVRGNARLWTEKPNTAKSKAFRLLDHPQFAVLIPELLKTLSLVNAGSILSLDFSDFNGWQVLVFALHTRNGRAIPVYFEIIRYPIKEDSQNIFVTETIEHLVQLVGCRPMLVMDRGFACPHIIEYLASRKHLFIVRIKKDKTFRHVAITRTVKACATRSTDQRILIYKHKLRLVISDKKRGAKERWYLVTNDTLHARNTIVKHYYHRFEIEEFFKDAKWINGMEHTRFEKQQSIAIVLWFVILGWWIMHLAFKILPAYPADGTKQKNRLGVMRAWMEEMEREKNLIVMKYLKKELTPIL